MGSVPAHYFRERNAEAAEQARLRGAGGVNVEDAAIGEVAAEEEAKSLVNKKYF